MFAACGSAITSLERIRFGGVPLDTSLARGQFRLLMPEEEAALRLAAGRARETDERKEEAHG